MNSNSLFIKSIRIYSELINYQTVRWLKKPFWMGIAKSKMFVLKQPKELPPDQKKEYNFLNNHYRTRLKSLMFFIKNENPKLKELCSSEKDETGQVRLSPALEKEISESYERNDRWNAESAQRREERKKIFFERMTEETIQTLEADAEEKKKIQEAAEEIVRKEKVLSKSYITAENLDEAIEKCLNEVINYDFAIDLNGKKYSGKESLQSYSVTSQTEVEQAM